MQSKHWCLVIDSYENRSGEGGEGGGGGGGGDDLE